MKREQIINAGGSRPDWLDNVEVSVEKACSALLDPTLERLAACQPELESIVGRLEEFCECTGHSPESISPELAPRLWLLRKQVLLMQAMIRQAAAFYRGVLQVDTQTVLGYTPAGLERRL